MTQVKFPWVDRTAVYWFNAGWLKANRVAAAADRDVGGSFFYLAFLRLLSQQPKAMPAALTEPPTMFLTSCYPFPHFKFPPLTEMFVYPLLASAAVPIVFNCCAWCAVTAEVFERRSCRLRGTIASWTARPLVRQFWPLSFFLTLSPASSVLPLRLGNCSEVVFLVLLRCFRSNVTAASYRLITVDFWSEVFWPLHCVSRWSVK